MPYCPRCRVEYPINGHRCRKPRPCLHTEPDGCLCPPPAQAASGLAPLPASSPGASCGAGGPEPIANVGTTPNGSR